MSSRKNDAPASAEAAAGPKAAPRRKPRDAQGAKPKGRLTGQPARRRVRVAEGIYKDRHGLAATVKVNGVQREVRFPPGTPLRTIRAKRDELRAGLRTLPAGGRHTLSHDSGRYLDQMQGALVSFGDRRRDLLAWLPRFGHMRTLALPAHVPMLNAQLHQWRNTLAASTCNHRRHALTNLVRVLYGRRASFDLLDMVRFAPPPPKPRWVDRRHIADVLAEVPAGSLTRIRLDLMHWTGMRPSQMGRLRAEDFRLDEPIPYVAVPRGKGGRIAAVPLVPEGVAAARAFLHAEAFGPWPRSSVNRALAKAARRAGRAVFTTYQIRHSFAAGLRRAGTDVADIQDLYGHTRPETTMIYAPPELAKHLAALERLRRDDGKGGPEPVGRPVSAGRVGWQGNGARG